MSKYQVNEIVEGTVVDIKPYGAIVLFDDETKGLLHISEIANTFIRSINKYLTIGKTYQVKILSIESDGFLKVSMSKITEEEKKAYRSSGAKRTPIKEDEIDFSPLKEAMPNWIKEFEEK
ncbi:MAG: S1 RNA-binding domain-containing protein [Bacilli bacterium]|nr:S1 RNA-binding domain-containing protein [Bacilli bacterium]